MTDSVETPLLPAAVAFALVLCSTAAAVADDTGSGPSADLIRAEMASPPTDCAVQDGVKSCPLSFTLENPSGSEIYWTGGVVTTAPPDGSAPVSKPILYGGNTLGPGDIKTMMSVCRVPMGKASGTWEATGTGHFPGNTDLKEFTWKLSATCP